jgi:adenosylhomocysteine nucleosidase
VAVFTATRWEFDAIQSALDASRRVDRRTVCGQRGARTVLLMRCGIGPIRAAVACRELLARHRIDLVVSAGYASALRHAAVGDLLIGTMAQGDGGEPTHCSPDAVDGAMKSAKRLKLPVISGPFASTSRVLCLGVEKRALASRTGAIAVDMESAALGAAARHASVPFLIVRAASDLADEDLPLDFNLFLEPASWLRGLAQVVRPAAWRGLRRLRSQASVASARLSVFFQEWLPIEVR